MTVGELREQLKQWPDFYGVHIEFADCSSSLEEIRLERCGIYLKSDMEADDDDIDYEEL